MSKVFVNKKRSLVASFIACVLFSIFAIGGCSDATSESAESPAVNEYSLTALHQAEDVQLDSSATADIQTCTDCHSYDSLAAATPDFNQYYNPHDSHYGELECYQCHSMTEAPELWCASCHGGLKVSEGWTSAPVGGGADF